VEIKGDNFTPNRVERVFDPSKPSEAQQLCAMLSKNQAYEPVVSTNENPLIIELEHRV
jgi:hypothetical protein